MPSEDGMSDAVTTFDSTKEALQDLLKSVRDGKTQLPDFQRGWVWDDERIRGLLASVSLAYPIGAVMLLQTGNPDVRLHPRPVEGATPLASVVPDRLVLDGQQRLTSLFQALGLDAAVKTQDSRKKEIERWYYIDIARALDPVVDREEARLAIPADRWVRNFRGEVVSDYSTTEKECRAEVFPLHIVY